MIAIFARRRCRHGNDRRLKLQIRKDRTDQGYEALDRVMKDVQAKREPPRL